MSGLSLLRLKKVKAVPIKTVVGKYVERKQDKLARKIRLVLSAASKAVAKKASTAYSTVVKADAPDASIPAILDELELEGISVDIVDSITPELLRTYKAAGMYGLAQVTFDATPSIVNHLDQAALNYAEERGAELVKDLAGTTREALRDVITDAVKDGWSPDRLSERIEGMGVFGEARADTISRTELAFAHVQGNVAGWKESGRVEGKQSILGDLHDIYDECDECAEAGVVPMDDDFVPGYDFPPYHPNCICDIVPVLKIDEEDDSE